jgi:hypothetical protein
MNSFAGDYASIAAFGPTNFHAGVYTFTGAPTTPITGITLDVENITVDGTNTISQASAAIYIGDFSTGGVTVQNVTVTGSTFSNNHNRGIDVRGYAEATLTSNILTGNGDAAWGAGGNDGYAIIARNGASITATLNSIVHPATSTTNVYALNTGNTPASFIDATTNSILMNGNANGFGASNSGGNTINATCNWWGDINGPAAGKIIGTVTFAPWLVSNDLLNPDCTGGRVWNQTKDLYFSDIQPAINAPQTTSGDVIIVSPGDYSGSIFLGGEIAVSKGLDIRGANYNVDPNTTPRGPESVIDGFFSLYFNNISINGFKIKGYGMALTNDKTNFPGALGATFSNISFSYNHVVEKDGTAEVISLDKTVNPNQASMVSTNWTIAKNRFESFVGTTGNTVISIKGVSDVNIIDNYLSYNDEYNSLPLAGRGGILLSNCSDATISTNTLDLGADVSSPIESARDAELANAQFAIHLSSSGGYTLTDLIISSNSINNTEAAIKTSGAGSITGLNVLSNTIQGINWGLNLSPNGTDAVVHADVLAHANTINSFKTTVSLGAGALGNSYANVQVIENTLLSGTTYYGIAVYVPALVGSPSEVLSKCNWYGFADYAAVATKNLGPVDFSQFATSSDLNNLQCGLSVEVYAFLEGPYNTATDKMKTGLNEPSPFPIPIGSPSVLSLHALSQPYNKPEFGNYPGTESVTAGFLTANDSIVDWILIELRDSANINSVVDRKAGFICAKGAVVGPDLNPLTFETGGQRNFHVAIIHRNHGNVVTKNPVPGLWDIRSSKSNVYEEPIMVGPVQVGVLPTLKTMSLNRYALYGGDGNQTNSDNAQDYDAILLNLAFRGYFYGDYNMDAIVNGIDADPAISNQNTTISFP